MLCAGKACLGRTENNAFHSGQGALRAVPRNQQTSALVAYLCEGLEQALMPLCTTLCEGRSNQSPYSRHRFQLPSLGRGFGLGGPGTVLHATGREEPHDHKEDDDDSPHFFPISFLSSARIT